MPLEILVERHGADSMLGAGPGSLRIPVFIDDAITAMRQMGKRWVILTFTPFTEADGLTSLQTCPLKAYSARMATSSD